MKLIFLSVGLFLFSLFHADGLAEYHYYMEQNRIVLKFEMDQNELQQFHIIMDCDKGTMSDLCTSNYILSHTNLKVNGKNVAFEFENSSLYNGHVILILKSKNSYDHVKDVQIENTCFYEINSKFKNRARFDFKDFQKSFMLTKGKELIVVQ